MATHTVDSNFIPPQHPKRRYRHGHKSAAGGSQEWAAYSAMRSRCNNPKNPRFPTYGARGIKVCERWEEDFVNFITDMGRAPSRQHSLDRIDNDKGYEPGNCQWATRTEQARNRRTNKRLTFRGLTLTQAEWAERIGMDQRTLHLRIKSGWTVERALTQPLRKLRRRA